MCAFECRVRAFECRELNVCCLDARVCYAYDVGRKRFGISSRVRSTRIRRRQQRTVGGHRRRRRRRSERPLCLLPILVVQRAESTSSHEAHDQLGRAHQRIHRASTQWRPCGDWRVAVEFGQNCWVPRVVPTETLCVTSCVFVCHSPCTHTSPAAAAASVANDHCVFRHTKASLAASWRPARSAVVTKNAVTNLR